jgi:hypothetical protein
MWQCSFYFGRQNYTKPKKPRGTNFFIMGRQVAGATPKRPRTWRARLGQERRPSPPGAPRSRIPSPGRCYFGGEFISWAESDIVINLEKVNFIEVKRYIDEWLLSGAVFG